MKREGDRECVCERKRMSVILREGTVCVCVIVWERERERMTDKNQSRKKTFKLKNRMLFNGLLYVDFMLS